MTDIEIYVLGDCEEINVLPFNKQYQFLAKSWHDEGWIIKHRSVLSVNDVRRLGTRVPTLLAILWGIGPHIQEMGYDI